MTLDPNAPPITTLGVNDIIEVYSEKQLKRISGADLISSVNTNINSESYGIIANGVFDNTSVLQGIINTVPDYSTIFLPHGIIKFSSIDIGEKTLTFVGQGAYITSYQTVTNSWWQQEVNNQYFRGTILKSTLASGSVIDATLGRINLNNLGIIGYNGLTFGVSVGDVNNNPNVLLRWNNVVFGNLDRGINIDNIYESNYQNLNFRGCNIGIYSKGGNSSNYISCSTSVCNIGIHLDGTSNTLISGGSIQGTVDTGILVDDSEEVTIQNIYFENANANYAINTSGISDRLVLINNHTGTDNDIVRINSNHFYVIHGKYGNASSQDPSNLQINGNYGLAFVTSNHGNLTNNGTGNIIRRITVDGEVLTGNSEMIFDGVTPVLKSPDGTLYQITVDNNGNLGTNLT